MDNDDLFSFNKPEYEIEETAETNEIEEAAVEADNSEEGVSEDVVETAPAIAEPVAPESQDPASKGFVPLAALQEEREKARRYRDEYERIQRQIEEQERAKKLSAMPDPIDDPAAYHSFVRESLIEDVRNEMRTQALNTSIAKGKASYGEDYVNGVLHWAQEQVSRDPNLAASFLHAADPFEEANTHKKRADAIQQIEADPDEYVRRRAVELGLVPTAPMVEEHPKPAPKNVQPKSIVNATSRGERTNTGYDSFFDAIDNKR